VNSAFRAGYETVAQLARAAAWAAGVAPAHESKLLRALRARHGIRSRYAAWARTGRDTRRPLLWVHAPSVGEGLQARPVLELARTRRPDVQLAYTHFSPSAATFAATLDVDFRDYLPFDSAADARAALDALRPRVLVFSKLDVWPTLTSLAHARGVKLGLVSATLSASSSRRSIVASAFLRDAYRLLDAVGAIDAADAERLIALGVRAQSIVVTGDTRYDQVWQRAQRVDQHKPLLARLQAARPTLVAGSTWPADEGELLPAFAAVRQRVPGARMIIAPHEPTPTHLAPIAKWAAAERISLARLDDASPETDVVLVDRVGVLGDLYALADVAFVGGGFHDAGLHSVLEPAAFGAPVLFGPRHTGSRDAMLLAMHEGGASVTGHAALQQRLARWLTDPVARGEAGDHARALVRSGIGAAERSFALVDRLLD
jgi:3-deoxy-D-manno-octulosonic-acid transferase